LKCLDCFNIDQKQQQKRLKLQTSSSYFSLYLGVNAYTKLCINVILAFCHDKDIFVSLWHIQYIPVLLNSNHLYANLKRQFLSIMTLKNCVISKLKYSMSYN